MATRKHEREVKQKRQLDTSRSEKENSSGQFSFKSEQMEEAREEYEKAKRHAKEKPIGRLFIPISQVG